jgi:hypothetical protein
MRPHAHWLHLMLFCRICDKILGDFGHLSEIGGFVATEKQRF